MLWHAVKSVRFDKLRIFLLFVLIVWWHYSMCDQNVYQFPHEQIYFTYFQFLLCVLLRSYFRLCWRRETLFIESCKHMLRNGYSKSFVFSHIYFRAVGLYLKAVTVVGWNYWSVIAWNAMCTCYYNWIRQNGCQSTRHMTNSSRVTSWPFNFTQRVTSWPHGCDESVKVYVCNNCHTVITDIRWLDRCIGVRWQNWRYIHWLWKDIR